MVRKVGSKVKIIFPIFYKRCRKCGNEYKLESMYKIKFLEQYTHDRGNYGCKRCYGSKAEFEIGYF